MLCKQGGAREQGLQRCSGVPTQTASVWTGHFTGTGSCD